MSDEHDQHFDGIEELDNPMPEWWLMIFYISVVFSAFYLAYYTGLGMGLEKYAGKHIAMAWSRSELAIDIHRENKNQFSLQNLSTKEIQEKIIDPAWIQNGKTIYQKNCVSCHGAQGEGLIGPNLTDPYWVHGGGAQDILEVVKSGVPAKGMIAWQKVIGDRGVLEASAFVFSLKGKNIKGPKGPEGEKEP